MITKTFGKLLLSGALAFSTIAAVSLSDSPILTSQASAAVTDDWPMKTYQEARHNTNYDAQLAPGDLKLGDTFSAYFGTGGGDYTTVKIYKVANDGSLQRYKTIYDTNPDEYSSEHITTITTGYPSGTYIAVMQYQMEFQGQIFNDYYNGGLFQIKR